jgi:hypothetical protein
VAVHEIGRAEKVMCRRLQRRREATVVWRLEPLPAGEHRPGACRATHTRKVTNPVSPKQREADSTDQSESPSFHVGVIAQRLRSPMSGIRSHPDREQMCVPLIRCIALFGFMVRLIGWSPR